MNLVLTFCMVGLTVAALLILARVLLGPTASDRIVAVDTLLVVVTMAVAVRIAQVDDIRYVPLLIIIGLLAFLSTVASARFVERDRRSGQDEALLRPTLRRRHRGGDPGRSGRRAPGEPS